MKKHARFHRLVSVIFVGIILCIFSAGLFFALFFQTDVNEYENRYANRITRPTIRSVLNRSFQDNLESAFADQIPFAQQAKKIYNNVNSGFLNLFLDPVRKSNPHSYISYQTLYLFGEENIVAPTETLSNHISAIQAKIDNYNNIIAQNPDIEFYIYYIEREADINLETNEKIGAKEYIFENINIPVKNQGSFDINSFEDFKTYFFKTDHHWNFLGSYRGYLDCIDLLGCKEPPLESTETVFLGKWSGSKALTIGAGIFHEDFYAHHFDYPQMKIYINGQPKDDYGTAEQCFAGEIPLVTYSKFYGPDAGETIFMTGNSEKENILVIGESNDNANIKLIASHFNNTYSVDLRNYEHQMGEKFHFSQYTADRNITKVLFIGNLNFYFESYFMLEE